MRGRAARWAPVDSDCVAIAFLPSLRPANRRVYLACRRLYFAALPAFSEAGFAIRKNVKRPERGGESR